MNTNEEITVGAGDLESTTIASPQQPTLPAMMPINLPSGASYANIAYHSLGTIAATLDNFSGKEVVRYFDKLEQRSKLDNWAETDTLQILKYRLVGSAYEYFKSDTTLDALNYTEFKKKLVVKFSPRKQPGEDQLKLNRCFQGPGETVDTFCTRIRTLGAKVLKEDLRTAGAGEELGLRRKNKELMINQFKLGLRKDLFRLVGAALIGTDNLTLEKGEELAEHHEMVQEMVQGRRNHDVADVKEAFCSKCKKSGHFIRDCFQQTEQRPCYICKALGHWANRCPQRATGGYSNPQNKQGLGSFANKTQNSRSTNVGQPTSTNRGQESYRSRGAFNAGAASSRSNPSNDRFGNPKPARTDDPSGSLNN